MKFQELIDRLGPRLKMIARKLDGKYTSFNNEDLYQEAILHLYHKFKKRELFDKTDSFILQGCSYFLKNYIRTVYKKIDQNSVSIDASCNGEQDCKLEEVLPSLTRKQVLSSIDANLLAEDVLGLLSSKEQRVFQLKLEGLSLREIGRRLGLSHVAVLKIKKKIREKCKRFKDEMIN
jgi:RNA polymerase sigma factor (sigma-70 family)